MSPQTVHAFAEKVALVTDGASRTGRAIALQLALQGAYVIAGFPEGSGDAESALNELKELGTLANTFKIDLSSPASARSVVSSVQELFGRLDLLVNCIVSPSGTAFENTTPEIFSGTLDKNLSAAFFITQAAVDLMRERPKPKIVNVIRKRDTPDAAADTAFAISQAAVAEFTRTMAQTLPEKFRVNCVSISSKERNPPAAGHELFITDKGVASDDVARVVLYLLSGEAVGLNGQILTVE